MKRTWLVGLTVWMAAAPVAAQGAFAAPNGPLGAGLSFSPEQQGRAYVDVGFIHSTQSYSFFGAEVDYYLTSLSWILGGGYKVTPNLELEVMLPMGWAEAGVSGSQGVIVSSDSNAGFGVGNLHFGANYLHAGDRYRLKVGGAVQYGPWNNDLENENRAALGYGAYARSIHDVGLWAPEMLSLVAPARFEFGEELVLGGDAALGIHIPTNNGDVELTIQIDPSLGYFVSPTVLLGARLPFIFVPTESGDDATQLAVEPYARFDIGRGFVATRFTLNIDDPLGFSFDEGKIWAIHLGGGGSF
jgi:hypothetical protein